MLHAVVMAGGSGTRFWPQSRRALPKQLLPLTGAETMIQNTVARVADWIPSERTWIVTQADQAAEISEQLPNLARGQILVEPSGRNTAPCIGLAAIYLLARDPDATMLVMPADHVVRPAAEFRETVKHAVTLFEKRPDALVLIGVPATNPSTAFGYIERGEPFGDAPGVSQVASFREKPDRTIAQQYVDSGSFYWNSGIFVWRAQRILGALAEFEPELHRRLMTIRDALGTLQWEHVLAREFEAIKAISIDHAVLERSRDAVVIEAPFEWDDVGSWQALPRLLGTDDAGNTVDGVHCGVETRGCVIRSVGGEHLIATAGVEDLIIIHTPDATLVARKDDEDAVRKLVQELEERGYERFL